MVARSANTGREVWRIPECTAPRKLWLPASSAFAPISNVVFVMQYEVGVVTAISADSGVTLWAASIGAYAGNASGTPHLFEQPAVGIRYRGLANRGLALLNSCEPLVVI